MDVIKRLFVFTVLAAFCSNACAEIINGRIASVTNKTFTIAVKADVRPVAGDNVQIFVMVPGVGKAQVGTAKITATDNDQITATIESATGKVQSGQMVEIDSPKPVHVDHKVPLLIGRKAADAKQVLEDSGFKVEFKIGVNAPEGVAAFTVYDQKPAAKTPLRREETVTVTLYGNGDTAPPAAGSPATPASTLPMSERFPAPSPGDRQTIIGRWICIDGTIHGQHVRTCLSKELLLTRDSLHWIGSGIDGVSWTLNTNATAGQLTYTSPKFDELADIVPLPWFGPARRTGTKHHWLYALDGDKLTLADNDDADSQPKSLLEADRRYTFRRMTPRNGSQDSAPLPRDAYPSLGMPISPWPVSQQLRTATDRESGVFVLGTIDGLAASKAGFKTGDQILTIQGDPVQNTRRFVALLRSYRIGESIGFTVKRNSAIQSLKAVSEKSPAINELYTIMLPSAESGETWAQTKVGQFFELGAGVAQDSSVAAEWYRKAADAGNYEAQYRLARLYKEGTGVKQDYSAAARWFQKSADQGSSEAQIDLGNLYLHGQGVKKNVAEAFRLYKLSAEQGDPRGTHNLGTCYRVGHHVAVDEQLAKDWLFKGAIYGQLESYSALAEMHAKGSPQTKPDYQEAMRWQLRGLASGHEPARYAIGLMHRNGQGVQKNSERAMKLLRKTADVGNVDGQVALGNEYLNGEIVAQDYKQAMQWYQKAAAQGDADASVQIGLMIYDGKGVRQQYDHALGWMRKGLGKTNGLAEAGIGRMYEEGRGVTRSYAKGIEHYNLGRKQGSGWATARLADMYRSGRGVAKRIPTDLYEEAATLGYSKGHLDYAWALQEEARRGRSPHSEAERRTLILKHLREAQRLGVEGADAELRRLGATP